ncbi:hypothetical protein P170DRAFT_478754 [Aspergillus steynii IBT 23096]|uniref:Uncharacterized protein n=1 Tax=Aspergillus steynii IBT 23096 TaxID=1392250 RepID=A0A2I2FYW3_9EURO|nr:uncharacterized protein P170DRAFT_478754 [Aspergillus steynii IBT 23096]PLB45822.1 hypothetical protein P170DRAFT_478754 [Aspergillus steynii IBT 23096]
MARYKVLKGTFSPDRSKERDSALDDTTKKYSSQTTKFGQANILDKAASSRPLPQPSPSASRQKPPNDHQTRYSHLLGDFFIAAAAAAASRILDNPNFLDEMLGSLLDANQGDGSLTAEIDDLYRVFLE